MRELHIFVRGMDLSHARMIYDTFIVSKWTFACFLQPITEETLKRLNALDAGFLSATTATVRITARGRRRAMLPVMRALARLPSPLLRRKLLAHAYTRRLLSTITDLKLPSNSRTRARNAHCALLQLVVELPAFLALVPDPSHPWQPEDIRAEREREWARAGQLISRPVPPRGRSPKYYPPAVHLCHAWATNLATRYHCNSFPILHRALPHAGPRPLRGRRPKPLTDTAVLTPAERGALRSLDLLQNAECTNAQLATIEKALSILRTRDAWARSTK